MEKKKDLSEYDVSTIPKVASKKVAIVTAEWNFDITGAMESACIDTLLKHGLTKEDILSFYVSGSYELPFAAKQSILKHKADAVICLGCIIQGETRHFDFIAQACANGIMQVGLECGVPVIFGVLTTNNTQQALDRAGGKHGNKGTEAAIACLKLMGKVSE